MAAYYKDLEILKVNEKYVQGYGWLSKEQYEKEMNKSECPAQFYTLIKQYNIQYRKTNGEIGQMDIGYDTFWKDRTFKK